MCMQFITEFNPKGQHSVDIIVCIMLIAVYIDSYVTMSSDLYGTCRHCFYGTRFGYCSKGTKSSSDNIVRIFIHPII